MNVALDLEVAMVGMITSIAGPELQKRAKEYESGEREFNRDEVIRDLKAAANATVMLNNLLTKVQKEK